MTINDPLKVLSSLLIREQVEGERLYWLLDQSALPQRGWLARHIGGAQWLDVLGGRSETRLHGASPIIVGAPSHATDNIVALHFADELYRVARFANGISLIASPLPIDELQAALCARARIELPGKLEAVLRYFDTRTLPLLPRLLSPTQYAALTLDMHRWSYVDRWGAVQCLPAATASLDSQQRVPSRLVLDEAQEAMLIDDGLTDAVIDLMLTQRHAALLDRTPPQQFDAVDPLVRAARTAGLCEPFEALAFVGTALSEGVDFDQREPWRTRLGQYRKQQCSIEEAFA
jgi:Domain of unknown function (DUF4123)